MKLGKDPPDLQVLMALFLQLILVNSSQAIMNEVPTMKMEPIPISDLKYGESNQHKANNRPQRWVQQSDYQPMQPHFQEQYMQIQYMEQPYQADISQQQDHAINAPISVYPNQDLTYQNQYIDYSGYSPNNNAQNEVQSNQFVEYSNPNLNTYAGNVQENDNLFQYQNERQQENQPYYNEEQQRDSLLLFTGYDDYDLTNTEWEIVNEHTLDTQQGGANDQSQEQSRRTNTDGHTNSFQQLNQDNNIDQGDLTADNDKTDIYLDSIRNPKMIWEEPLQQEHSHEAKIDNIQSLQQQLLETQNHLMQLYQDLKHDKMIDHPEQDSSSIKYKYENKEKDIVEPELYYDQNSAMDNQLGLTDNIIENEYESGVIYKYENDDSQIKMDNIIFPYNKRQFNEPKYTYKHPKKVEKDFELPYKIPKEKDIILDLKYKFPKSTKDQIDTVTIDSKLHKNPRSQGNGNDNLYRYKKGRSMDFENLEEKQPGYNLEDSNSKKIEKAHSVDNNIPLKLFGNIRGSPESEENGLMEANIVETKNKDISLYDIPKTKMSDKKAKVRKIDRFEKCDPWDPNTKTESVTSDTNIGEGTLKRTISKRYCDNNSVDNNSGQNSPCFKTITTETTVLNEYCLLPEYQDKNEGLEPCFKNTTTTLSVTKVPCDKTEDNLLENENLTAKNESKFVTTPNIEGTPSIKLNNSSVIKNLLYNNKTTEAPISVTTGPLDNNLFQNDNLTTINTYPSVTIPPKAEITPTMDNNLFENDNLITVNTYPPLAIPPKAEITPAMDMNGSLTENKLSDTKIDNNSDCLDYRQYNKDFTNSNGCIIKSSGVSEEDINIILELHNLLRSKVARGEEKRGGPGPQAPAANMKELRWNNDLARAAQAWAQQCPQENAPPKYRKICSRNYEIGQNVAYFGVKIDDKVQQNEKHNGEGLNKVRKKRSIDQSNSFEDSLIDEDISDAIIDDNNDLEDSIIDDDNYLEDAIIDDDKYLEDSIIDDDNYLEDSIIDDNNYLEDSMINDDKYLEDSIIDNEKSFEDSIIDDDKSLEDSIIDDDNYLEASMINYDKYLEDSLIDDDKSLEDSIIDKDKSLEDSIIDNDKSLEDSIIDDDNYLENSLIDDDKYLEDSIIDDDKHLEVTIIADDKYLEDSIIDDDKYIEDSIIDDDKYLEDSMIDDNKYLEDSIIDDDKYIEDSKIDDDKYLEDSIIDDDKYLEDSIIDDDKYLEDSIIDDDLYIEHEIIGKDTYIEDSIIDDDMYLEDKIIDKDTDKEDSIIDDDIYLEEEIIGKDTDKDNSIIDDDMHSDEEIIEDDKSVEDMLIDDISNDDEAFVMNDTNDDEAVIALKSSADQFIESDNNDDHLISNVIEHSEEIVMDKGESNMDLPIRDGHIEKYMEKDTIPKLHSYETELENMNIFNSLDKAQDKRKGWKNVIMNWYKGVDVFPNYMVNTITNLKNNEEGMDAYLQVVWAETEEIGCSVVHFSDNRQKREGGSEDYYYQEEELSSIYVCNYGPAASRDKLSVYTVGDAGTQCLDGVSPDYHDLCRSNSSFT